MAFKIDAAQLKSARIFVGCPMYDGRCHAEFTFALCQLAALCTQLGIALELYFAAGEALVMKARNAIADRFLQSDATHLMLIDSDIGFQAVDVLSLLALQMQACQNNDYDVVSAPYPLKRMLWEQIAQAARQGLADAEPANLQYYAGNVLLRPARSAPFELSEPLEVTGAGTGFMMIRRRTLERFQSYYPQARYASDEFGIEADCSARLTQFFDTGIDGQSATLDADLRGFMQGNPQATHPEILDFLASRTPAGGAYVSEDFMFCRQVLHMGLKLWSCPWMVLTHIGSFAYNSRLSELTKLTT